MSLSRPRLQFDSSHGEWTVLGHALRGYRYGGEWFLSGMETHPPSREWVHSNRLLGPYRTRTDLLNILASALEESQPPACPSEEERLVCLRPGRYLSGCGRVTVERELNGGWRLTPTPGWRLPCPGEQVPWHARSLRLAALSIRQHRENLIRV